MPRVYVEVIVRYSTEGKARPLTIVWENGREYPVDRVLDIRPAAALKAGGRGMRYTCRIGGGQTYLFEDDNRWFVEAK